MQRRSALREINASAESSQADSRIRACGFCGGFLSSRDRYFDHVARHYEDGCNKSHWNHSLVIYGLLHQPSISQAWKELKATLYDHLPRGQQPIFEWNPEVTGHAQGFLEGESPGKLQDLLEFFDESRDDPQLLARLAHDSAIIRFRHELQQAAGQPPTQSSRPISEPPKPKPASKTMSSTRHMSTPQPTTPQQPPPPSYNSHHLPKKQRSIAPAPSTFAKQTPNVIFEQSQSQSQPTQPQSHGLISPFTQSMTGAAAAGFYDLTVTHVYPHMQQSHNGDMGGMHHDSQESHQQQQQQQQHHQQQQQQQQLVIPMNVFDDWSSQAGTVVDESVFAGMLSQAYGQVWQHGDMGAGHGHPGAGG